MFFQTITLDTVTLFTINTYDCNTAIFAVTIVATTVVIFVCSLVIVRWFPSNGDAGCLQENCPM